MSNLGRPPAHLDGNRREGGTGKASGLLYLGMCLEVLLRGACSPDPILTGALFAETIRGIQSEGVIACAKHYIANEQEHFRQAGESANYGYNISESLSTNIDDATMHELYLWPFAEAVRAGVGSVMCSYNQINNSYGCQNSYIQNYLLKGELDFQGFIVSDWGATHSGVSDILAGLDMTMPGDSNFNSGQSYFGANLTIAALNGSVPEWRIDDMATRIIAAWYKVGRDRATVPVNFDSWTLDTFGNEYFYAEEGYGLVNEHIDVRDEHASLIRQIGSSSTVLLKNNNTLPLTGKEKFTAVFGYDAGENPYGPNGCIDRGCDNGTLAMGWGSGTSSFPYLVTPDTAIQNEVVGNGGIYQSITNNYAGAQILALASQASVAIVFANADSGEGYITVDGNVGDRNNLTFWNGADVVVQNVSASCNNTILVIHSSGAVSIGDYADNPNITAILWAGLPGQETGNSIADVLYGRVNPSAKLPFTLGRTRQDYGTDVLYKANNGEDAPQLNFTEGIFIDYRSFDQRDIDPVYEFGYGLSYTNFSYSNLQITRVGGNAPYNPTSGFTQSAPQYGNSTSNGSDASAYQFPSNFSIIPFYIYPYLNDTDLERSSNSSGYGDSSYIPSNSQNGSAQPLLPAAGAPGGNAQLYEVVYRIQATVTNTGNRTGEEVAQLYLSLGGQYDPPKVLRGFQKLSVQPDQSATFVVDLTRKDLSNWDVVSQNWVIRDTQKTVYVGASSRDLPLQGPLSSNSTSMS